MKLGLWNIDHPEYHAERTSRRYQRTIKGQWRSDSSKTYPDSLEEQLAAFETLASRSRFIIAGDFNLKINWPQKRGAFRRVRDFVKWYGLVWPTETQSVQHVIHSPQLTAKGPLDLSVKGRLSDHPFLLVDFQENA